MEDFKIGFTACYIKDYKFTHLTDISTVAALEWVKNVCPDVNMGLYTNAKDLTYGVDSDTDIEGNGWLNKLFILISNDHGRWIALYNHDQHFSVYIKDIDRMPKL